MPASVPRGIDISSWTARPYKDGVREAGVDDLHGTTGEHDKKLQHINANSLRHQVSVHQLERHRIHVVSPDNDLYSQFCVEYSELSGVGIRVSSMPRTKS